MSRRHRVNVEDVPGEIVDDVLDDGARGLAAVVDGVQRNVEDAGVYLKEPVQAG